MTHPVARALSTATALLVLAGACDDSPSGPSGPLSVQVIGPDRQATVAQTLGNPIVAVVKDAKGKPAANRTVTWTVLTEGGGSLSPATSTTNANGEASTQWTLGTRAATHELQVSVGSGNGMDTVRATALPGPAASASVVNHDTLRTLEPGQAAQVALAAVDQYGNAVPMAGVTAQWSSRDAQVATAAGGGTGTVTAQAPGRTVVDVTAAGTSLRVHVTVRGLAQTVFPLGAWVTGMHGGGGRMLASTLTTTEGRALWERTAGAWTRVDGVEAWERQVRVLPSGEGWIGGRVGGVFGVFRSPAAGGAWTQVAAPVQPNAVTSVGGTVFIAQYEGGGAGTAFRREAAGWTAIPSPPAGDSAVAVAFLGATGPADLVIGGTAVLGSGQRPYLARWNGTTTTRIPMPAGIPYGAASQVTGVVAASTGKAYAVIIPDFAVDWRTRLLAITGNTATELANPVEQADLPIRAMVIAPDGSLWVGGETMVARYDGTSWRSWNVRESWTLQGGLYVDEGGHVWAGVLHNATFEEPASLRFELIQ